MEYCPLDRVATDDLYPCHRRVSSAQIKLHTPRRIEQHAKTAHIQVIGHGKIGGVLVARYPAAPGAAVALLVDKQAEGLAALVSGIVLLAEAVKRATAVTPHRHRDGVSGRTRQRKTKNVFPLH